MDITEGNTLTCIKGKDISDFRKLFFKFHGNLVLFANKFTGDMQDSQDLVQDAFMKLWEQYQADASINSPKAYLFQAVRNNCLNHYRHLKTKYTVEEDLASKINSLERSAYFDNNNPLQSLLELEMKEKIETLVETMPEKCQKVYKMSRHDFLKNKEIANELDISVKMVEKHISKALMTLRFGLSDYQDFSNLSFYNNVKN
jgi:RNA polymerase sigma-70 factor (ECF subfamily)